MNSTSLIRKMAACILAAVTVSFVASCNTTRGLGRDVEKAGEGIQRTANRAAR